MWNNKDVRLMSRLSSAVMILLVFVCGNSLFAGGVAEYLMEEGSATLVGDTSGSANNAYFVGQPVWQAGHGAGSQYCLDFDGSNYLEAPDSVSLDGITGGFTMSAWINADLDSVRDTIVWKLGAFRVWKQNANLMVSLDGVPNVTDYQIVSGLVPNGIWLHVAVTYDGRYIAGYVNGVRVRRVRINDSAVSIATSNYPLRLGWYGSEPHYRGSLDNVRLYDNALSTADVIADMNSEVVPTLPLTIVESALAATAIVIPTGPLEVETVAANELQYHIEQATGVILGIHEENVKPTTFDGLIYVGACDTTAAVGIEGSYLDDNGYVLRNIGSDLFLAGHDSPGNPLGMIHVNYTRIGSMLAVYRFLEDYMGVKWLWPGPIGEIIPTMTDLVADGIAIIDKPVLKHPHLIDYGEWNWNDLGTYDGWSSMAARENYLNAQSLWLRRQGFCKSISLEYTHAFGDWWDMYGSTHPEYFNQLPDGTRRPDPYYWGGWAPLVSMCLSEPTFHQKIVDNWIAGGQPEYINCIDNDTAIKCTGSRCMSWDVEDPDLTIPWAERLTYATNAFNAEEADWYKYLGSMSTRLAKFLLAVQQEAESRGYPDAKVFSFSYFNYANKPLGVQLNDRVTIGVVPAMGFPWTQEKQQYSRDLWSGWADADAQLFLRPNYFLEGHNLPMYIARRFGSDFLYSLRRGMLATFFDTLTGQWSTQSLNLYMLARLNTHVDAGWENWEADVNGDGEVGVADLAVLSDWWLDDASICDPGNRCGDMDDDGDVDFDDFAQLGMQWQNDNVEIESILDEFYEAFGPAESAVRAYFGHWEAVSDTATTGLDWAYWFVGADEIFTPTVMAAGRTLITNAQTAALGDAVAVRLVDFLEKGLTNAEKTLAAQVAWENYDNYGSSYLSAWQAAYEDLSNYRASVEADFICNMGFLNWSEMGFVWTYFE